MYNESIEREQERANAADKDILVLELDGGQNKSVDEFFNQWSIGHFGCFEVVYFVMWPVFILVSSNLVGQKVISTKASR